MRAEPLEGQVGLLLRRRGWRLAAAESCSGGLLGHRITNVPGSSDYFLGGVIAYDNSVKMRLLGVQPDTLEQFGAVSRQTVLEMAGGVRATLQAEVGISISGIAGPGGGTPEKPVGLVWIGLSAPGFEDAWRFTFSGGRLSVKKQSAEQALRILFDCLAL
jgi:PncC family amidohydrolase